MQGFSLLWNKLLKETKKEKKSLEEYRDTKSRSLNG
jgi:hypothetical protein